MVRFLPRAAQLVVVFAFAAFGLGSAGFAGAAKLAAATVVDAKGNLSVPPGYRSSYEFFGSWAVAADQGAGSKEMHSVYASPGTTAAFKRTGKFPVGTVLVKEVFAASTAPMSTGTVSHVDTLKGWFVMVKDDGGGKHADSKLWGDGWGWSWFDAGNTKTTTSTDYKNDCKGCHIPASGTDWIYIQGYPSLKAN
jgi:hypothetical protein